MNRTLIQKHSSSIVRGLAERVKSLSDLGHKLTKGELRELFVSDVLKQFLTSQFDIGSGIIINQAGKQSNQTDIIIYDNRTLPPFIREQHIGVYPAESVLATIEVKSHLTKEELMKAEAAAQKLHYVIYDSKYSYYKEDFKFFRPLCAVIGFYGRGGKDLSLKKEGKEWLNQNIKSLFAICLMEKFSWMRIQGKWNLRKRDVGTSEETKRFIAVTLDNVRTYSEMRLGVASQYHRDWLGIYMRDQGIFK